MSSQELISTELAKKITEYEREFGKWQDLQKAERRGALYAAILAAPLWIISYLASATTGPVNQASWLTFFTAFTFVGAVVASIAFVISLGSAVIRVKPRKNYTTEGVEWS